MPHKLLFLITFIVFSFQSFSQETVKTYFDKSGKKCDASIAYYYRVEQDSSGYFKSYYQSNNRLYFKGKMSQVSVTDENLNLYTGNCNWYHRNGLPKQTRQFTEQGLENGLSKYYYESGKIWKELEFENGILKESSYIEYNEDGSKNKLFEEEFSNNVNEWDLYSSDKSIAKISDGMFDLISLNKEGSSRYINVPIESADYTLEVVLNISDMKQDGRGGIIYGFKDWQNYHYFAISKKEIFIGSYYEGVKAESISNMFCSVINPDGNNTLKIITSGDKQYFSVNGEVQYKESNHRLYGNNLGIIASGKSHIRADRFVIKQLNVGFSGQVNNSPDERNVKSTGSGVVFTTNGYILTNHHVVDNSTEFIVELNENSGKKSYKAELVISDKENDIAILKIKDSRFNKFDSIRYSFKENGMLEVGGSVFTIGYPHALTGMGREAKFTDGRVSSKTGYNGSINSFQTTIPVQPGNSGGPVFNLNGQLIGLINATFKEADNVSYVIKLNYIRNLIELVNDTVEIPTTSDLSTKTLEEKLKILPNYVVLIKVM